MISIDTNVLLRYLLQDDEIQSKKATHLIDSNHQVLITDVVLVETIWTLRGKKYKLDKESVINVINALFEEPNILFEDGQTIWRSMNDYKKAKIIKSGGKKKEADFPDALIVNKSKTIAQSRKQQMEGVYTFDVAAQEIPGTKKP